MVHGSLLVGRRVLDPDSYPFPGPCHVSFLKWRANGENRGHGEEMEAKD